MKKILDYEIIERIDETVNSIVYRGRKDREKGTVIIKVHNLENSSLSKIARFKQEYEIIKNLNFEGILKTYDIIETDNRIALVLEDFKGSSLKTVMRERQRQAGGGETRFFLETAISISDIVGTLHKNNVIHKDIKPHNLLINPETGMLKLIDFGISSELSHEHEEIYNRNIIEGTLVYMSPEQTGRISRGVDYRTDIYSMGITFYEMLTGAVPFRSKDPLEIIHAHIAKKPTPPVEIDSSIPPVVSDIVMKLLAKSAEDRYQNSFGVMADLSECLGQLKKRERIDYFEPGKNDISIKFNIPRGLFGRDEELGILLSAFERVSDGAREMMLVAGAPGIGKSVLINEVRKPIVEKRGAFISGKYEQFGPGIPYSSLITAFRGLVRQLLSESSERITRCKEKLHRVLGNNGKIITDVIPNVELIIGEQPDVPQLGPEETRNRFNIVFKKFIRVFAQKEHPLVLFLDDLQWADIESFSFIENVITDQSIEALLIIGAYRDTEVDSTHPVTGMTAAVTDTGVPLHTITLRPLDNDAINRYIGGFLRKETGDISSLTELVHKKTNGNPFFINQFIKSLYDDELLTLDSALGWQWDVAEIRRVRVTDNVVELMANKITKLKERSREMLKTCACIGNRFNPERVSLVTAKPLSDIIDSLMEAIDEGLLVIRDDVYEFQHDRIQEGAYSLIPEDERAELHYKIGRMLLRNISPEELRDDIFLVVNQLNYGIDLARDFEERHELAELNLLAGRKAKTTSAYNGACRFFTYGIEFLSPEAWEREYELALALYTECGEACVLSGDTDEAQRLLDLVLDKAKTALDMVKAYETKIMLDMSMNKMTEALAWAMEALSGLGVHFPKKVTPMDVFKEQLMIKSKMRKRTIEELLHSTENMTDPRERAIARLLMIAFPPSYIVVSDYFSTIISKHLTLSLQYGGAPTSAYAYATYGMLLCNNPETVEKGYRYGRLALGIIDRSEGEELKAKVYLLFAGFISHWKRPVKESLEYFMEAHKSASEHGDFGFGAYSLSYYSFYCIYAAEPLDKLKEKYETNYETMKSLKQESTIQYYELRYQLVLNLRGESDDVGIIKGEIFDEEESVTRWQREKQLNSFGHYIESKIILYYLHGFYKEAVQIAEEGKNNIEELISMYSQALYNFYYSLALLAIYSGFSKRKQKAYFKQIKGYQRKMLRWSKACPENFLNKYLLVQAALAGVTGKNQRDENGVSTRGEILFNRAIETAKKSGFLHEEGIANEAAACFYRDRNYLVKANIYMKRAHASYSRWGAVSKVKQIEKDFPALKAGLLSQGAARRAEGSTSLSTTGTISESLDLSTVVRATRAISGEIVLSRLLSRLMQLTLENAGAEKGCLLLEKEGKIFVEAEGEVGNSGVRVLESVPVELHPGLSPAMVNSVERTKKTLILTDAQIEGEFTRDPYVLEQKPKSVLCMPIISQGKLTGMVYLENDLMTGAFTPERLEILQVISSQVAISIDNARLYDDLEQKNEKLIELDELKDEFLANTSHELRTPLNGIIGIADSLLERDDLDEESGRNLSLIVSSGRRLTNLVNDVLDFSKLKNRDIGLNPVPLDIKSLTDVVIDLSRPLTRQKGLELVNAIDAGTPAVNGDENRLQQILFNLVGNSIKFTESGEVRITADVVEAGNAKGRFIRITVSDTGIGIPPDKQDDVFKSFEQVDGSIARQYGGTGIGLSIVKQLVELHGGEVGLVSAEGAGSSFFFTIPAAEGKARLESISRSLEQASRVRDRLVEEVASAGEREGVRKSSRKGARILAVDDDLVNLQVINNYLSTGDSTAGYDLTLASGGIQALDLLKESDYDLVLLDIMMPGISGYEVCRVIREQFSLYELPVIILTARNTIPDLVAGFEAGANDYLTKPLTKSELLVRVNTLVTLKRTVAEHKEAKFKLLQDRMSPHFLFNSLNTIHGLLQSDVEKANSALLKLAHNYRFLMDQVLKSVIPFEEEWVFLKNYLELQELQLGEILSTEMTLDGSFGEVFIPPLTIQPILHNCLKHGQKGSKEDWRISVRAERRDEMVRVVVENNDTGLNKEGEDECRGSLDNILQRLKYLCKEAAVTTENSDGGGTRVEINFRVWHE